MEHPSERDDGAHCAYCGRLKDGYCRKCMITICSECSHSDQNGLDLCPECWEFERNRAPTPPEPAQMGTIPWLVGRIQSFRVLPGVNESDALGLIEEMFEDPDSVKALYLLDRLGFQKLVDWDALDAAQRQSLRDAASHLSGLALAGDEAARIAFLLLRDCKALDLLEVSDDS